MIELNDSVTEHSCIEQEALVCIPIETNVLFFLKRDLNNDFCLFCYKAHSFTVKQKKSYRCGKQKLNLKVQRIKSTHHESWHTLVVVCQV